MRKLFLKIEIGHGVLSLMMAMATFFRDSFGKSYFSRLELRFFHALWTGQINRLQQNQK